MSDSVDEFARTRRLIERLDVDIGVGAAKRIVAELDADMGVSNVVGAAAASGWKLVNAHGMAFCNETPDCLRAQCNSDGLSSLCMTRDAWRAARCVAGGRASVSVVGLEVGSYGLHAERLPAACLRRLPRPLRRPQMSLRSTSDTVHLLRVVSDKRDRCALFQSASGAVVLSAAEDGKSTVLTSGGGGGEDGDTWAASRLHVLYEVTDADIKYELLRRGATSFNGSDGDSDYGSTASHWIGPLPGSGSFRATPDVHVLQRPAGASGARTGGGGAVATATAADTEEWATQWDQAVVTEAVRLSQMDAEQRRVDDEANAMRLYYAEQQSLRDAAAAAAATMATMSATKDDDDDDMDTTVGSIVYCSASEESDDDDNDDGQG